MQSNKITELNRIKGTLYISACYKVAPFAYQPCSDRLLESKPQWVKIREKEQQEDNA